MTHATQLGLTVRNSQFAKQFHRVESQKRKEVAVHAILLIQRALYFHNLTNEFKLRFSS